MILYVMLGMQIHFEDIYYPGIHYYWAFVAFAIRSSIGDIQPPRYTFWLSAREQGHSVVPFLMVYFIWLIWFCTQFINLVILLNFLIAVISQSYEDIMSREIFTRYSLRSHMN